MITFSPSRHQMRHLLSNGSVQPVRSKKHDSFQDCSKSSRQPPSLFSISTRKAELRAVRTTK